MARSATVVATAVAAALLASFASLAVARAAAHFRPQPIARAADGHYWATAQVEGRPVRVLVDTGATAVALTAADARALGIAPERLDYSRRLATASGAVRAAPVTLSTVEVGGARVEQVSALVVDGGLGASLLGMSFLDRLSGFSADRDGLVLRR
ncbi:MAG: TIGR02281 family clan AA aspartic protease [Caulobacteraceae bacterium]|nr:TIGR02281 family clan AA aspartic protease [Caulobacter sp.]